MDFELREWIETDIEDVAVAANNEKIAANLRNAFPYPYTLADAGEYVKSCIEKGEERQYTRAITVNQKAVGSIGVFLMEDVYEKSAELGYWLSEDYWRKGIMSTAVKQICKEVFQKYPVERIYAEPFEQNSGSRGVLEKAGFTYEGTMRKGVYKKGKFTGYCMYSLLREEFV